MHWDSLRYDRTLWCTLEAMSSPVASRRFPRWVFGEGSEPDPRFTLANERTFLAWIRTALALLACGIALEAIAPPMQPQLRLAASVLLIVLGLLTPVQAWFAWSRDERAMRNGRPLSAPSLMVPLAVGTAITGVLLLAALLLR
jgi:putative membrane protein